MVLCPSLTVPLLSFFVVNNEFATASLETSSRHLRIDETDSVRHLLQGLVKEVISSKQGDKEFIARASVLQDQVDNVRNQLSSIQSQLASIQSGRELKEKDKSHEMALGSGFLGSGYSPEPTCVVCCADAIPPTPAPTTEPVPTSFPTMEDGCRYRPIKDFLSTQGQRGVNFFPPFRDILGWADGELNDDGSVGPTKYFGIVDYALVWNEDAKTIDPYNQDSYGTTIKKGSIDECKQKDGTVHVSISLEVERAFCFAQCISDILESGFNGAETVFGYTPQQVIKEGMHPAKCSSYLYINYVAPGFEQPMPSFFNITGYQGPESNPNILPPVDFEIEFEGYEMPSEDYAYTASGEEWKMSDESSEDPAYFASGEIVAAYDDDEKRMVYEDDDDFFECDYCRKPCPETIIPASTSAKMKDIVSVIMGAGL